VATVQGQGSELLQPRRPMVSNGWVPYAGKQLGYSPWKTKRLVS